MGGELDIGRFMGVDERGRDGVCLKEENLWMIEGKGINWYVIYEEFDGDDYVGIKEGKK